MRVTTLKASTDRLAGLLAYYAGLAEDRARADDVSRGPMDYYLDPEEPAGRWWGHGCRALGLDGEVAGNELRALMEGRHPRSRERLGRAFGDSSARGFDATFSAPKSVSVLWALTPDSWVRAEVLAAHDTAVDAALGWFETHGAVTRRGRDGVHQVDTQGVAVAVFRQHTSRSMDPQLHTHAVIAAKVQDPSGRWLSLDARFLKYQQRTIGWVYDAALRTELTARLGVAWDHDGERFADLTAVPEDVRAAFSQRSDQVDAKVAELLERWRDEHDGDDPDPRAIATLERAAVLASRPAKEHALDAATVHDEWAEQANVLGLDPARMSRRRLRTERRPTVVNEQSLVVEALRRVQEESATWLRADLVRHLTHLIPPNTHESAADLVAHVDRLAAVAEKACLPLGPPIRGLPKRRRDGRPLAEHVTDRRLTTPDALDQEQGLQAWATNNTTPPPRGIDDPQHKAVNAITGHASLALVVGPAGTGKTTATARAVGVLRAQRRPVVGLAPSGRAADVLAEVAGCPTETLAAFLTRHQHPAHAPAGTTVILDEAGMAATDDLARLVALVQHHKWRLVAIGDPAQLPAVGRGGVFTHWCHTLPHIELTSPRRFRHRWEAAASFALRAGDPAAAVAYDRHDRLRTLHPALLARDVARLHRRHTRAGRSVAITTTTTETARAINQAIQHLADPRSERSGVALGDGTTARVGDQVATRRNDPSLVTGRGHAVRNRHTWTITAIRANGALTVSHRTRGRVQLPVSYVAEHVELGWAVTGYGNQGDTTDIGLAILEAGTTRNHAYVALTRGRHTNTAIIPDPDGTLHPAEALAALITRAPHHDSALAVQARLHREAGLVEPPTGPPPDPAAPSSALDTKVRAIQQRLDHLQRSGATRSLGI